MPCGMWSLLALKSLSELVLLDKFIKLQADMIVWLDDMIKSSIVMPFGSVNLLTHTDLII